MAHNTQTNVHMDDLPPPYSAVVGNAQYGFVIPPETSGGAAPGTYAQPKTFTPVGVYPHPAPAGASAVYVQPQMTNAQPGAPIPMPVGIVIPPAVGNEPTTVNCFNCGKTVTTRVNYTTAWHTHLVSGSICLLTMVCSLCCLGVLPYFFDAFKDAEHYCPNCNTFIAKNNKC